ncbi:hypothetical protein [Tritonibacter mobilis]|uniref:hypothetical protein n=1 Tax=Tritonibacter mobilis TaxID=379347 RepID=UPI000E0DDB3C|nr:hypothetical protein [Tritonibacter mobilis]
MRARPSITVERLDAAIADVAQLVVGDGRYMPIFERLLVERVKLVEKQDTLSRAHAIVRQRAGQDCWSDISGAKPRTMPNRHAISYPSP